MTINELLPTWNKPSGCVLPIPTRPSIESLSQLSVSDIAVNTDPPTPTSNLFFAVKQSKTFFPPNVPPPDTNNFLTFTLTKLTVSSVKTSPGSMSVSYTHLTLPTILLV